MGWRRVLAVAIGAAVPLLPALTAAADDHPQPQPIRDVTVEYQLVTFDDDGAPSRARMIKVFWADGGAHMRIEMAGENSYVILDRTKKLMTTVLRDQQGYIQLPYDPQRPTGFTVPVGITLVRAGTEIIVGNTCNVWVQTGGERSSQLCVTDDGVLLHAEGRTAQRHDDLRAKSVVYGPAAPSVFAPPADFKKLNPPRNGSQARTPG